MDWVHESPKARQARKQHIEYIQICIAEREISKAFRLTKPRSMHAGQYIPSPPIA